MQTIQRSLRFLLASLFSTGMLLLVTGTASTAFAASAHATLPALPAHASVLKAIPAIGSTVTQAPTTVTVFTAENINPDPKKSNMFVYGPSAEATNKLISQGNATVSLTNPQEMSITIKPDAQHSTGVYIVHWIPVSALDGDPDEGAFTFTVKSGAAATPTATPAATATTTGQTTSNSNNSGNGGTPIWATIVIALAALVVGLGGGFGLGRRRSPSSSVGALRRTIHNEP